MDGPEGETRAGEREETNNKWYGVERNEQNRCAIIHPPAMLQEADVELNKGVVPKIGQHLDHGSLVLNPAV